MTGTLAHIWRHPIKSHGRESLDHVTLAAGETLPGDRLWAVAHDASKADGSAWVPCVNFTRAAKVGSLTAIRSTLDEESGRIALTHPELPPLEFDPATEGQRMIDWVGPLMPADRARSVRLVQVPGRGMTDTPFPSISLLNSATNQALSEAIGIDLSPERWRGNLLIDGLDPWAEWDWIGRSLRLGEAVLKVEARITRCNATKANPATGETDADTLGTLNATWGHQDFGIYVTVAESGRIALGDRLELI
ncbi:MOSC domain-containing protein [Frigidibacter sp. ROC022]|uniref:MOSC domain-containing protein n=1 Tax=Frigidibacter sp. ROC022 TaxID=2971796 RepID=UPI00215B2D6B|nr:MOSC N-terminal beta barrel domain-containing protein [Frigidibacter sp. ROC022]MCR8725918.1 MOSC domain-containing protein [Frigidibacter sp. ROC022]